MNLIIIQNRFDQFCTHRQVSTVKAFSTLELTCVITILLTLGLGIFDLMNIIRADRIVQEAAIEATERFRNIDINGSDPHDNNSKYNQALQMATDLLVSGLPGARFNCGNSTEIDCASVSLQAPVLVTDPVTATVSYNIPVTILGFSSHLISRTASRRMQTSYTAVEPMHITTDHY